MTITSDKRNTEIVILLFVIIALLFAILWVDGKSLHAPLFVCILPFFLVARYWIATNRKITISQNGCIVRFLWYKKEYPWGELKVKRFADYTNAYGYKSPYLGGAEFSPNMIHKPRWLRPLEYSILFHPFSFFFVYFFPKELSKTDRQYPMIYTVDEAFFREKMKEWDIQLQEDGKPEGPFYNH